MYSLRTLSSPEEIIDTTGPDLPQEAHVEIGGPVVGALRISARNAASGSASRSRRIDSWFMSPVNRKRTLP